MDWYCLIHHIPPKPLYLRAKIRQRLASIGALALKNSVYLLPRTDESLEDFQWLAQEIESGGGTAFVCAMSFVDAGQERAAVAQFRTARAEDYLALKSDIRELQTETKRRSGIKPTAEELPGRITRLRRRAEDIQSIDFFPERHYKEVSQMLDKIETGVRRPEKKGSRRKTSALVGKTWVTRRGVKVDRIATAWLIRRFVDPDARLRLVDLAAGFEKGKDEITFDMPQADFSHQGEGCTFESLLDAIGARTPALQKVAEIVHDIDLKDGKYGRPETAGIQRLIEGILQTTSDDEQRFARGFELFDQLHESFRRKK